MNFIQSLRAKHREQDKEIRKNKPCAGVGITTSETEYGTAIHSGEELMTVDLDVCDAGTVQTYTFVILGKKAKES